MCRSERVHKNVRARDLDLYEDVATFTRHSGIVEFPQHPGVTNMILFVKTTRRDPDAEIEVLDCVSERLPEAQYWIKHLWSHLIRCESADASFPNDLCELQCELFRYPSQVEVTKFDEVGVDDIAQFSR